MKDIKLSFPYPSTSRHNLSQDVSTSMSMGLVTPIRIVKVLPGDSHRIATSFSLISNPLVKPLLQGVRLRYCRFWVPARIYHLDQRANNSYFDPLKRPVRYGNIYPIAYPSLKVGSKNLFYSNFQQSSLFDYLGIAPIESNFRSVLPSPADPLTLASSMQFEFNAEPYLAYVDICRNYFADSASGMIAWSSMCSYGSDTTTPIPYLGVVVSPLKRLDDYIDNVQNSRGKILPYDFSKDASNPDKNSFTPFVLKNTGDLFNVSSLVPFAPSSQFESYFTPQAFGMHHWGLCVPLNRPDRLSRLFDTKPLVSQNATIAGNEISIGNLSFLAKLQRYLTRRFFGGSRFTDVMYSVFGQRVPHVDSPVLLDVFDEEIGSELVASTNATETQNPGVLGGYFSSAGVLSTGRGRSRKRYTFNEDGYLIDLAYIMPRLNRAAFYNDFYPVTSTLGDNPGETVHVMSQGNWVPDFNGIGWQQPAFISTFYGITGNDYNLTSAVGFCCEPSWQQYRTLPDVCHGALNPVRGVPGLSTEGNFRQVSASLELNSPLFTFNDRPSGVNYFSGGSNILFNLASFYFSDFNDLNRVFGFDTVTSDNIFVVFRYAHQAKRQVTKRFTLSFN